MGANKFMLNGTTLLDLTSDTITEDDVAEGVSFHDATGERKVGTAKILEILQEIGNRTDATISQKVITEALGKLHDLHNSFVYFVNDGKVEVMSDESGAIVKIYDKMQILNHGQDNSVMEWSDIGSELGAYIAINNDTAEITVPSKHCLVWSMINYKLYIKSYTEVSLTDYVLFNTAYGQPLGGDIVNRAMWCEINNVKQKLEGFSDTLTTEGEPWEE